MALDHGINLQAVRKSKLHTTRHSWADLLNPGTHVRDLFVCRQFIMIELLVLVSFFVSRFAAFAKRGLSPVR